MSSIQPAPVMDREGSRGTTASILSRLSPPTIERPYFTTAIVLMMTVGALWGVWILLRIAINGSFVSVGLHEVNAHGHAQIFGWVGLFVMGFAYRMFPAMAGRKLPWAHLAELGWGMMLVGVLLRAGLQPFVTAHPAIVWVAQVGSVLEVLAIGVFVVQMAIVLRPGRETYIPGPSKWLIRGALCFFFLQAVASAVYFHLVAVADSRDWFLWLIANFQPPLRDLQVHGFATLMVLGVGAMMLPRWFGTARLPRVGGMVAAVALTIAVLMEITGFLAMRLVGTAWAGLWGLAALMLLGASGYLVVRQGLLRPFPMESRAGKFIRIAHAWLLVSLVMLVGLPVWQFVVLPVLAPHSQAVEIGFSHAYYGSIRHAITVGFISMMILGMSVRLMERTRDGATLPTGQLWVAFVLVNVGCLMRVVFQAATDMGQVFYPVAGMSGVLELSGIGLWALWMIPALWLGKGKVELKEGVCP